METDDESNRAKLVALKLDKSLKLWVWMWQQDDDRTWFELHPMLHDYYLNQNDIHPRTYEFYLKHGELLAVSKELPTWVPIEKPSE